MNGIAVSILSMDANTDTVTVAGADGALVVLTVVSFTTQTFGAPQTPLASDDDTVHGEDSTLPLIIFGGQGNDTIFGGNGGDIIFGDRGRVIAGGNVFGNGGLGDTTDGLATPVNRIQSVDAWVGGNDTITAQGADDVLIGGSGADTIVAGGGANIVFGDNGRVDVAAQTIATTRPDVRRQRHDHGRRRPGRAARRHRRGHDRGRRRRRHRPR